MWVQRCFEGEMSIEPFWAFIIYSVTTYVYLYIVSAQLYVYIWLYRNSLSARRIPCVWLLRIYQRLRVFFLVFVFLFFTRRRNRRGECRRYLFENRFCFYLLRFPFLKIRCRFFLIFFWKKKTKKSVTFCFIGSRWRSASIVRERGTFACVIV